MVTLIAYALAAIAIFEFGCYVGAKQAQRRMLRPLHESMQKVNGLCERYFALIAEVEAGSQRGQAIVRTAQDDAQSVLRRRYAAKTRFMETH